MNRSGNRPTNRHLDIGYSPFQPDFQNKYIARSIEVLSHLGLVRNLPKSRDLLKLIFQGKLQRFDVAISNWDDTWIVSTLTGRISLIGCLNYFARILLINICARKTIFVRHDRYPHYTKPKFAKIAQFIVDVSQHAFSHVVVHSGAELEGKRSYVPHPLYPTYPGSFTPTPQRHESYYVIFGRILRYKQIDQVISCFPVDQKLLVVGPCDDSEYLDELNRLSRDKQIRIVPRFIDERSAAAIVRNAAGLIVCHVDADMIVSGSYFFALTHQTPVLAIRNAFYTWAVDVQHAPGLFLYSTIKELCANLEITSDIDRGEIARFAERQHGDSVVIEAWSRIFQMIGLHVTRV